MLETFAIGKALKLFDMKKCFHCGEKVEDNQIIIFDDKKFCCQGCKTVYEIFSSNDLVSYYDFEQHPGATPKETAAKFNFLDNQDIVSKLLDFEEGEVSIVRLYIPHIHCSSCIWILEHLNQLNKGVISSQVVFSQKKVTISFNHTQTNLKQIVLLLAKIGYEPYISLESYEQKPRLIDRSLLYRIGVAFFGFGNIMLLSIPEYFNVDDLWMQQYRGFFRYAILLIALPVFFYSGTPYYKSAWRSIKAKSLNIDVPMALGIIVMFVRSLVDIFFQDGQGYLDSMSGLVFFMLSGKLIQQTTFNFLSFERDYKSYFPIAITKLEDSEEVPTQVYDIQEKDKILIRNQELIPVDAILLSEKAYIDYSFVTGEAVPVEKKSGEKIYAGGKQVGRPIQIQAISTVSQSYLTQLWGNEVFQKQVDQKHQTISDKASQIFTPVLITLALVGFVVWSFTSYTAAFNVFTAVLIVACPCAIALTAPYTWGNAIRILGRKKMYLKNTIVIEQLAKADTVVFDKTGTITANHDEKINYQGESLSSDEINHIKNLVRGSNHPLSRRLYLNLPDNIINSPDFFEEIAGQGIVGQFDGNTYKIGSATLVNAPEKIIINKTSVHISVNDKYKGYYEITNHYRKGLSALFLTLKSKGYQLFVVSGDNEGERNQLEKLLPENTKMLFNQKPEDKLNFIKKLQSQGKNVLMIGDGLNDAGALAQSNVGISISEDVNVFTPASDAILDAGKFGQIDLFLHYAKKSMKTIRLSYVLALTYNVVGLSFALTNQLSPLFAAIIMPVSTVTIIGFVTLMTHYYARKTFKKKLIKKSEPDKCHILSKTSKLSLGKVFRSWV